MFKKKKKLLTFFLFIISIFGLTFVGFKNGFIEDKISTTRIPFEIFKLNNKKDIKSEEVKDNPRKTIDDYKKELEPILSVFTSGEYSKPILNDKIDLNSFEKILNPIYGVEYQYVGKASMSGLIQDKDGWNPLITLSVYNDSENIRNITMKIINKNNVLSPEIIKDTSDNFSYSELPSDFNISLLDLSSSTDKRFYQNKIWEKSSSVYSSEDTELLKKSDNNLKTKVLFIYSDSEIHQISKFSTEKDIYTIDRKYSLDSLETNSNLLFTPITITKD